MAERADGAAFSQAQEWHRGSYVVSTDQQRIDLAVVHGFLTTSPWASGVPLKVVQRAIAHSLVLGVYTGEQQIRFARVITDYATFAHVADVFILAPISRTEAGPLADGTQVLRHLQTVIGEPGSPQEARAVVKSAKRTLMLPGRAAPRFLQKSGTGIARSEQF